MVSVHMTAVAAESLNKSDLSSTVDQLAASYIDQQDPGCAIGVIHNAEYVHKAGYGMANLEHNIPITPKSIFRTGSVSKQFTAMTIAILAERGDLDLDSDVHEYLPDLMDYGYTVTVRQMVHHLAGMGDYESAAFMKPDGTQFRFGNEDYWTTEEFYEAVTRAPLIHAPETKWEYSNLGYFLLAMVVEKVSGKTLRAFAAEEIFDPLQMQASFFNDNVNEPVAHRADGYRRLDDGSSEIYMTNLDWVGDGGVYTNLDDFIAWDQNFYANKLGAGGDRLIEMTTTPHPVAIVDRKGSAPGTAYAFGQFISTSNGERVVAHSGGWVAFSSKYQRYPDLALSVVVFCNTTDVSAREVSDQVAEIYVAAIKKAKSAND